MDKYGQPTLLDAAEFLMEFTRNMVAHPDSTIKQLGDSLPKHDYNLEAIRQVINGARWYKANYPMRARDWL